MAPTPASDGEIWSALERERELVRAEFGLSINVRPTDPVFRDNLSELLLYFQNRKLVQLNATVRELTAVAGVLGESVGTLREGVSTLRTEAASSRADTGRILKVTILLAVSAIGTLVFALVQALR